MDKNKKFLIEEVDSIVAPAWYDPSTWSTPTTVAVIAGAAIIAIT